MRIHFFTAPFGHRLIYIAVKPLLSPLNPLNPLNHEPPKISSIFP